MGEAAMDLTPDNMAQIGEYVRGHIHDWIEPGSGSAFTERDLDQSKQVIRVEVSFKNNFKKLETRYGRSDKYGTDWIHQRDKKFEKSDRIFKRNLALSITGFILLCLMLTVYEFLI